MPRRPKRVETAALSVCRKNCQNHYYAQMRANTYALNGVAALDGTGVAVPAADGSRGRKERESKEGEGSSTGEHSERRGLG